MSALADRLAAHSLATRDSDVWRPERFDASDDGALASIERLLDTELVRAVHDTLWDQLSELVEIRNPEVKDPEKPFLDAGAKEILAGCDPDRYGTWVYYPWSMRLVHVLPEAEFREVRLSRNRNKITGEEQARLGALHVGVAGLSVGQASAIALAMEGIGGRFRLADFDTLSLSNLNRLRGGIGDLGVNKAMLAARSLFDMDPYLEVEILPDGVTEDNHGGFLDGLDLLIEECDDLYMKIRLREGARARRIAVIMDTNDRGLLDIERFDLEPERPILHGLVGDLDANELKGLSNEDKVPYVLDIVGGAEMVSPRLAASLVEIGNTLNTWPQLASDVQLGAALCADVARRIAWGEMKDSGRYRVDLGELVADGTGVEIRPHADEPPPVTEIPTAPELTPTEGKLPRQTLKALAEYGVLAPSGGNCQPWKLVARDDGIRCLHDVKRSESFLDFEHRASYLAIGALTENVAIAASHMGFAVDADAFPVAGDPLVVCDLKLRRDGGVRPDPLASVIAERSTNRRLGKRVPLEAAARSALLEAAASRGGQLHLLEEPEAMKRMGGILARGDRLRFLSPIMHKEMMGEVRWTPEEALRTRDGLDIGTLELTAADRAGMQVTRNFRVMDLVGRFGGGHALGKPTRKAVDASSALGLVTFPGKAATDGYGGGRALQRVWLTATAQGLAFQPLTAIVYLFIRLEAGGEGLTEAERKELTELRAAWRELLPIPEDHSEMMLFRLAKAPPPSVRALRRPVEDVISFA